MKNWLHREIHVNVTGCKTLYHLLLLPFAICCFTRTADTHAPMPTPTSRSHGLVCHCSSSIFPRRSSPTVGTNIRHVVSAIDMMRYMLSDWALGVFLPLALSPSPGSSLIWYYCNRLCRAKTTLLNTYHTSLVALPHR